MPDGSILKIVKARISKTHNGAQAPGSVLSLDNGVITVSCGEGAVDIEGVLPQGKGRMRAADFINGRKIKVGDILS